MKKQMLRLAQIANSFEKQGNIIAGTILTDAMRKIAQEIEQEIEPTPEVADTKDKKTALISPQIPYLIRSFQNKFKNTTYINSQDIENIVMAVIMKFINNPRPFSYFKGQEKEKIEALLTGWVVRRILNLKEQTSHPGYGTPESSILSEDQPGLEGNFAAEGDTESELFGKDPTAREALNNIGLADFTTEGSVFSDGIFNLFGATPRQDPRRGYDADVFTSAPRTIPTRLIPALAEKSIEFLSSVAPQLDMTATLAPPPGCEPQAWATAMQKIFQVAMRGRVNYHAKEKGGATEVAERTGEPGNLTEILRTTPGLESVEPQTFKGKYTRVLTAMKVAVIKTKFQQHLAKLQGNEEKALKATLSDFTGLNDWVEVICDERNAMVSLRGLITASCLGKYRGPFPSKKTYDILGIKVVDKTSKPTPTI